VEVEIMYRVTGIGTSLVLIAAGAILIWAVDVDTDGFNLNNVGVILLIVGAIGFVVSLVAGLGARPHDSALVERNTVVEREPVRERVVERDRF
jgi:uncharacterized YccA/Bax inhibitor family protein